MARWEEVTTAFLDANNVTTTAAMLLRGTPKWDWQQPKLSTLTDSDLARVPLEFQAAYFKGDTGRNRAAHDAEGLCGLRVRSLSGRELFYDQPREKQSLDDEWQRVAPREDGFHTRGKQ
jgi:hypothetical protein